MKLVLDSSVLLFSASTLFAADHLVADQTELDVARQEPQRSDLRRVG